VIFGNKPDPIYGTKGKVVRLSREGESTKDKLMTAVALHQPAALEMLIDHLIETGDPHGEELLKAKNGGRVYLATRAGLLYHPYGPRHKAGEGEDANERYTHGAFGDRGRAGLTIGYTHDPENSVEPSFADKRRLSEALPLFLKHKDLHGFANYLDHTGHKSAKAFRGALEGGHVSHHETPGSMDSGEGLDGIHGHFLIPGHSLRFHNFPKETPAKLSREPIPSLNIEEFGKGVIPWMEFADHLYENGTAPHHQKLADAINYAIHHGNPYPAEEGEEGGPRIMTTELPIWPAGPYTSRTLVSSGGVMVAHGPHSATIRVTDPTNVDPPVDEHIIRQYHRLFNPRMPDGEGHINIHKNNEAAKKWAVLTGHPMIHPRVTFDQGDTPEEIAAAIKAAHEQNSSVPLQALKNPIVQRALREPGGRLVIGPGVIGYHLAANQFLRDGVTVNPLWEMEKKARSRVEEVPEERAGKVHVRLHSTSHPLTLNASVPAEGNAATHPPHFESHGKL
jgi:hypothetical protein